MRQPPPTRDPAALSRGQHAKLAAIGIGHDHPAYLVLTDVDTSRPEVDQTVDLPLLITVNGGARSKCSRFFPVFGIIHAPSQEIFGPPCGERIAVWRP